jgi:small subunit ribosomal protein S9
MAKTKNTKQKFIDAVGRRKRSVARVRLFDKAGDILVNDKDIDKVYADEMEKIVWMKPFHIVGVSHPKSKFSATIKTHGGGIKGQIEAIQLGITRALIQHDPEFKTLLKKAGLTTRDPREVERKKTSQPKARKKVQYSKR